MKVSIFLLVLALVGCGKSESEDRYQLTSAGDGKVFRLDKRTGEVALVTPDGIRPVGESKEDSLGLFAGEKPTSKTARSDSSEAVVTKKDLEAESVRRAELYAFLNSSQSAQQTKTKLQAGQIGKEEARNILSALLPKSLGPLPPDSETEDWGVLARKYNSSR
jgi:hypothetical protein